MSLSAQQLKQLIIETSYESLKSVENVILHNIQRNESEYAIVQGVNSLLSTTTTREKGLELVNLIISYCSLNALTDHSLSWSGHCMIYHATDNLREIKLKTLGKILESTTSIDAFNKKFLGDHLLDTLKACLSSQTSSEKIEALKCLSQCMKRFPSWFTNHKHKVEPFLVLFMESSVKAEVKEAGVAFVYFQQTGGAGVDGVNYINNFAHSFNKICSTIQTVYDAIFESITAIDNTERINVEPFTLSSLPSDCDSIKLLEKNSAKIINLIIFLKTLICKQFPVPKQITPKHVIDVITRGLSIHVCLAGSHISVISNYLFLHLNKIQIELLQLLRVFLIGHTSSILPFTYVLSKLLINVVRRTQNCACFITDQLYKKYVYKTVSEWLSLTKSGNLPHLQDSLLPLLLNDISPVKKKVLLNLNVSSTTRKRKSKQKPSATVDSTTPDERILYNIEDKIRENTCMCALELLETLLETSHLKINSALLQEVTEVLVKTIAETQTERTSSPYTNSVCQVKLYSVLISIFNQNKLHILPPLHLVINVFKMGLHHSNVKISDICRRGLITFEKISQPVCPSLYLLDQTHISSRKVIINSNELDVISSETPRKENGINTEEDTSFEEFHYEQSINETTAVLIHSEEQKNSPTSLVSIDANKTIHETVVTNNIAVCHKEDKNGLPDNNAVELVDLNLNNTSNQVLKTPVTVEDKVTTEPPEKKQKTDDQISLDDMFMSFQNVIQE